MSDRRLTLVRDGVADRRLEGLVAAERFVDVTPMQVSAPIASLRKAPEPDAEQEDQLVFGELFDVLFEVGDFAFGQARRDRYVGYVLLEALSAPVLTPDHRIAVPRTYAFAEPDIKSAIVGLYSLNALVTVEAREGRFVRGARSGWFVEHHLAPVGRFETDYVAVAERFLHAPYQWGGRESLGLDCSALVQQALYAAILRRSYGIDVHTLALLQLHPLLPTYDYVPVDDLADVATALLDARRTTST